MGDHLKIARYIKPLVTTSKHAEAYRGASIRIPRETERDRKAHKEDRRPSANYDPYRAYDAGSVKGRSMALMIGHPQQLLEPDGVEDGTSVGQALAPPEPSCSLAGAGIFPPASHGAMDLAAGADAEIFGLGDFRQ